MIINIQYNNELYAANLKAPLDISIPIQNNGVGAWNLEKMRIDPVEKDGPSRLKTHKLSYN